MATLFCKDCRHIHLPAPGAYDLAKCHHVRALKPNTEFMVSGKKEPPDYLYASSMRVGVCGEDGLLFEAKNG